MVAKWPFRALRIVLAIFGILLVTQYILGLYTNLYAPASGFTSNSSMPALDWHYNIGYTLGVLAILAVVFAVLTRTGRLIGPTVVMFLGVLIAGFYGGAFVGSAPNNPLYSLGMGIAFLAAFATAIVTSFFLRGIEFSEKSPAASAAPTP
ncbi:MAG TPA: hypothetical protein VFF67_10840 [Thermoplasmata archaeon]|nr:hypothetical protein [Thermoplasmata archaeon]